MALLFKRSWPLTIILILLLNALLFFTYCRSKESPYSAYLFAYFVGNGPGEEQVHYAISPDGYNYVALNHNRPVIRSEDISKSGGVRDPHILRGNNGEFYMVLTDLFVPEMGWQNTAMVLLKSSDLINWTHTVVDIPSVFPENFGEVNRVWAPQTIYDQEKGKYMVYWSMRHHEDPDIIYYAYANSDFTNLESEPRQLLYKNGACIDGDIVFKDGKYYLFFKNEDQDAKGIMLAISEKINEGYQVMDGFVDQTDDAVEGSGTFKLIGKEQYILMYDLYSAGKYQFCVSDNLETFRVVDQNVTMNFHPRHGSIIPITQDEMDRLLAKWGGLSFLVQGSENPVVRTNNIEILDSALILPVKQSSELSYFDPMLKVFPGVTVSPAGPQDFGQGNLSYSITMDGKTKIVDVQIQSVANPVLDGFYADPEIIFSKRDKKYYLYPTSDGFYNWSGNYFEVFESDDLVTWKNRGVILDLRKDVKWADRNAWAPTAIERKEGDDYRYYFYFTAAQKIGVAVAENPAGPFKDSGNALIDYKPEGVKGGQEIDPDVFYDPKSGKYFLYWGNMYMAVAELNPDMTSIKKETIKVITPDQTYREGTEVFYRKGIYYFLWSEDDTRSPNYRVRYATAESPTGPLHIPQNNLAIEKDPSLGIYGTGHNSVIYVQENDQWYIIYHRFNKPNGINMGRRAGFNREVCIDKLNFNAKGDILPVQPTLEGISSLKSR